MDGLGLAWTGRVLENFKPVQKCPPVLKLDGVTRYLNEMDVLRTELPYFDPTRDELQRDVI